MPPPLPLLLLLPLPLPLDLRRGEPEALLEVRAVLVRRQVDDRDAQGAEVEPRLAGDRVEVPDDKVGEEGRGGTRKE